MYNAGNLDRKKEIIIRILHNEHVLICGREGTGKTSFVKGLKFRNRIFHYFERYLNVDFKASNFASIFYISNVFMQRRIIVLDNFDTIEQKSQKIISEYIKKSVYPVVVICNNLEKVVDTIKEFAYIYRFDTINFDDFKKLIGYWKINGMVKAEKDLNNLYAIFASDGNIRRLMNNYMDYENQTSAGKEEISAKKLASMIMGIKNDVDMFKILKENEYKIKTIIEYINVSLGSYYSSLRKIEIASDILSYINTILFESSNIDYIIGLLLTLPERDFAGRMTFIKVNTKGEGTAEVEGE
jgi:DNA polymerase III delta prime subunit